MAFTADQLLTFADLTTLMTEEEYFQKGEFTASSELVTKAQITAALYLDGTDPLSSYTSTQHVRYGDITPLGTGWVGDTWECEDDTVDNPPTAPTIVLGSKTDTTVNVDWGASPGTDDNGINFYTIEISSDGGSNYGDPHTIQDILLGPDEYTYTGLSPSTSYKFRVRSIDTIGQVSSWSNILTTTTNAPGTDYVVWTWANTGYSNGPCEFWIRNDSGTGDDYVTVELEVTSGGTADVYDQWRYLQWNYGGGSDGEVINGVNDAPITFTFTDTTVIYTGNTTHEDTKVYSGGGFRSGSQVGFKGWAYGRCRITNSSQGNTYPTGWFDLNIISGDSGQ